MKLRISLATTFLLLACGCTSGEPEATSVGTWVGTITTEGNVTTVVNESGSVWGDQRSFIEEASIGVGAGADEYLLGSVRGIFATDQHIYVLDGQVPQLRYYDFYGTHIADIGGPGQGPGEYQAPWMLAGDKTTGRLYLYDATARITVFSTAGEVIDTWAQAVWPGVFVAGPNGTVWARQRIRDPGSGEIVFAIGEFGPDGVIGDLRFPPPMEFVPIEMKITTRRGDRGSVPVPFAPRTVTTVAPDGSVITGSSDRYRIEIHRSSGKVTAIERRWTPVPVERAEADWHQQTTVAALRAETVAPDWNWSGPPIPIHKPAYQRLIATASGEVWVLRQGPGRRLADCAEKPLEVGHVAARAAPCWRDSMFFDVFGGDGRYLGAVESPKGLGTAVFVDGTNLVAVLEDEAGTIMVKRYRLVLPGEDP